MKSVLGKLFVLLLVLTLGVAIVYAQDNAALYKSKCALCHGPDGKGSVAGLKMGAKDFHSPEAAKASDAEWFNIIKKGKNKMPAYDGKLTDAQIKELVSYVRALK